MPPAIPSPVPADGPSAQRPGVPRSATLPSKVIGAAARASSPSSSSPSDCETLFVHPTVKVVKFDAKSTGASRPSLSPRRGDARSDVGTLPWSTLTEMTVAAGPLSIYRVPSSGVMVSFLKSGSLLHPILIRAPSWCVDGESKFVLRTPGLFYYRIELPYETDEEKALAAEFKVVLAKISRYEKTPCPFTRRFHVEIQKEPEAAGPSKANKWKTSEKAKRWTLDSSVWEREDGRRLSENVATPDLSAVRRLPDEDEDSTYGASEDGTYSPHDIDGQPLPSPKFATFPSSIGSPKRSPNLPLPEFLHTESESAIIDEVLPRSPVHRPALPRDESSASSINSFYSVAETVTDLVSLRLGQRVQSSQQQSSLPLLDTSAPSKSSLASPIELRQPFSKSSEDVTSVRDNEGLADTFNLTMFTASGSGPARRLGARRTASTPNASLVASEADLIRNYSLPETPEPTPRRRLPRNASHRRTFSPRPRTNSLILSSNSSPQKQLSTALLQKTYEVLMSPPAHLVALMLRIAARVVRRAQDWTVFESKGKKRVPGTWESSSEDDSESSEDDDFGMPLRPVRSRASTSSFRTDSSIRGRSISRSSDGVD